MSSKKLLVAYHSRSGSTRTLCDNVAAGAQSIESKSVELQVLEVSKVTSAQVIDSSAIILGTPINFGYMSGLMKDFLERIFYECIDHTKGKPYGLFVKGDTDIDAGLLSLHKIIGGLEWKEVFAPVKVIGPISIESSQQCFELGATICAGLDYDLY